MASSTEGFAAWELAGLEAEAPADARIGKTPPRARGRIFTYAFSEIANFQPVLVQVQVDQIIMPHNSLGGHGAIVLALLNPN